MSAARKMRSPSVDVVHAVCAAEAAAPELAETMPMERAAMLAAIANALSERADSLIRIAAEETSLGRERLESELARTTGQLRLFADVLKDGAYLEVTIDHAAPDAAPARPDLRRWLEPIGPVAVFTASNFPFAFSVAGGDTASALAAGCPVVVKAHSGHPKLSRATVEAVQLALATAGAPDGTLTHVEGREAGRQLVLSEAIKAVGFTGSLAGGRALFDLAVGRPDPIPFYGELSSINPVVISPLAASRNLLDLAAGLIGSVTIGVGQFCTKPGVVLVPFETDLIAGLRDALGSAAPGRMLTDGISESYVGSAQQLAMTSGVEVVAGAVASSGDTLISPVVFATNVETLLANPNRLLKECFGPAVVLVRYRDAMELAQAVKVLPGALTATMHIAPEEYEAWRPIAAALRRKVGRLILGGWPTGVAVTWSMQHGGPWPATTSVLHTSVGATAIRRFLRPVTYQGMASEFLPPPLRGGNPLGLPRRVDGRYEKKT